jgi:hypothetical protein
MGVRLHCGPARDALADVDDRAPFRETGPEAPILRETLAQTVEALRDGFAGTEGQRLGAEIDFDAGIAPVCSISVTNAVPPVAFCRIVSS